MIPIEKGAESISYAKATEDGRPIRGGTTQDKRDMWRVGREQELNVFGRSSAMAGMMIDFAAQLPVPLRPGIYGGVDVHMGGRSLVCPSRIGWISMD